jgi:hypothetical protein
VQVTTPREDTAVLRRSTHAPLALLMVAAALAACTAAPENSVAARPIEQVLAEVTPKWMKLPGVVGTAIGADRGKPCIDVYVTAVTPELRKQIPTTVEGHTVRLIASGPFEKK